MEKGILEYIISFTFEPINKLIWCDDFKVNEEWPVLRINNRRIVQKSYHDKSPYNEPKVDFDIALYSKSRWYCLNTKNNIGTVIKTYNKDVFIPNLKVIEKEAKPHVSYVKFKFDLQILGIIINNKEKLEILEKNIIKDLIKVRIDHNSYMEIKNSIIKYKGNNHKYFYDLMEEVFENYNMHEKYYKEIYKKLGIKIDYDCHESMSPLTWHKAKRSNQLIWPEISLKEGLEFPKNSGIYYKSDKYVGLAKRNDDNPEIYIPKITNRDHTKYENSILYKYINDIDIEDKKLPDSLNKIFKVRYKRKMDDNDKVVEIDFNGDIINTDINPEYVMYNGYIICDFDNEIKTYEGKIPKGQILDKNNKRAFIITDKKIKNCYGYQLRNIITLPWYYKQIVHDYNKLGRLKKGVIMDLTHIGIVKEKENDIITFPYEDELYIGSCLQTHRLTTFKSSSNVIIKNLA